MNDLAAFFTFYITILLLGLASWPLARAALGVFPDKGWVLSKSISLLLISYVAWLLGMGELLAFTRPNLLLITLVLALICWLPFLIKLRQNNLSLTTITNLRHHPTLKLILIQEIAFIAILGFWAIVRAYNPDIFGLEKYMDYGFLLSILRAEYFPPLDHFFAGEPINYYYFGHLMGAILTRLSTVPPAISYNLLIAYLGAMTFISSFSVSVALITQALKRPILSTTTLMTGLLGGAFTGIIGNLHAALNIFEYKTYWYATASRLIPFTINEFPVYSFVVADLHAHVNNLPIVLLIVALLVQLVSTWWGDDDTTTPTLPRAYRNPAYLLLIMAIGSSYATNAWDYPIYLVLTSCVFFFFTYRAQKTIAKTLLRLLAAVERTAQLIIPLFAVSFVLFIPYWRTVVPPSQGIGLVADQSPLPLVLILWGMFFFLSASFVGFVFRERLGHFIRNLRSKEPTKPITSSFPLTRYDLFAIMLMAVALLLIIIPEIMYVKDIYPQHYRANTMFKLYYQAWVMFSIATAYGFVRIAKIVKQGITSNFWITNVLIQYVLIAATLLYPYLAINSATGSFREYQGLDGTAYLARQYPDDAAAIDWLNQHMPGQPTVLEAAGDSYTEYARVSSNTGLPTVLGWQVHEWLWRGSYGDPVVPASKVLEEYGADSVSQRNLEVQEIYTGTDKENTRRLLQKYDVDYIFIGTLERTKYPALQETLLTDLGTIVYQAGTTIIIKTVLR